ncbi:hypothetical protein ACFQJC_00550 [Haloferax namakaokahaiae]|uniref:DUF7344 domain-containing protein n=1 Tax=Haloferax namakaokahaiae TaxID=1748331 RepID=A0ABD5ZA07_9EURY
MASEATPSPLDDAVVHDVLRNERRRLVLEQLRDEVSSQSVGTLAEHIAEVESGESPPPKNVRQSVYISLHQTHLPKLDALHIVSYDSVQKEVTLGSRADELDVYFDDPPVGALAAMSFVACLIGLVLVLGSWMQVPVITSIDPRLIAVIALVVATAVTGAELTAGPRRW